MAFRSEEDALRERVATLEAKLATAADAVLEERKNNRPVRWFALAERFGGFLGETWKVTFWGLAVVGTAMMVVVLGETVALTMDQIEEHSPVTPLGATCNNLCSNLGMRQVSHWRFSDGYRCDCAGDGRSCSWDNVNGMSCVTVP